MSRAISVSIQSRRFLSHCFGHTIVEQSEIFCYAEVKANDEITERLKRFADHWRVTVGLSDELVAAQIAEDDIDILVDLPAIQQAIVCRFCAEARTGTVVAGLSLQDRPFCNRLSFGELHH